MAFIKKYLFFIILIACVVAFAGGPLVAIVLPMRSATKELVDQRVNVSKSLLNLRRSGPNRNQLLAQQEYVDQVRQEFKNLIAKANEMNRQDWQPLNVVIKGTDPGNDQTIAVFPVDREVYEARQIPLRFAQAYDKAMVKLLAQLNPASPPTGEEITLAADRMQRLIEKAPAQDETGSDGQILPPGVSPASGSREYRPMGSPGFGGMTEPSLGPTGWPMTPGSAMPLSRGMSPGAGRMDRSAGTSLTASQEAMERAIAELKINKADDPARPIYADASSLYHYGLPTNVAPKIEDMWKANVTYWLQEHVVEAIIETNREVTSRRSILAGARSEQANTIANAAVKRLVSVSMGGGTGTVGVSPSESTRGDVLLYDGEARSAGSTQAQSTPGFGGGGMATAGRQVAGASTP
ncbi:MAG: hypothetical protein HQ546_02355, partial [Planctomycetes bacterium]|nr:hypothetical protein [Planctomycetota bacterium]